MAAPVSPDDDTQLGLKLKEKTVEFKARIPASQARQLDQIAALMDLPRSSLVRECLGWYLRKRIPHNSINNRQIYREVVQIYGVMTDIRDRLVENLEAERCCAETQPVALETLQNINRALETLIDCLTHTYPDADQS